jgi:basic membrane protein A
MLSNASAAHEQEFSGEYSFRIDIALHELSKLARTSALLAGAGLILSGCGPGAPPSGSAHGTTVCLVTTSQGINDRGFNQLALQGAQSTGATVRVIPSRTPDDYLPNLQKCAQTDLTVAVSSQMANPVWHAATQHVERRFLLVDAEPMDDLQAAQHLVNVESLLFKAQDAGYLVGALTGLLEQQKIGAASHNVAGILGTNHRPAVDTYIAGFVAGARSVDPAITFQLTYSDSDDVAACKQIGISQIAKSADVLFEVTGRCAAGYIDAAYDAAAYAIGSDSDLAYLSPAVITSALKRVDHVVALAIGDLQDGNFKPGLHVYSLKDDAIGYSTPSSVVPQSIINQLMDIRDRIRSGSIVPPDTIPPGV